jgi:hypothetical protein
VECGVNSAARRWRCQNQGHDRFGVVVKDYNK